MCEAQSQGDYISFPNFLTNYVAPLYFHVKETPINLMKNRTRALVQSFIMAGTHSQILMILTPNCRWRSQLDLEGQLGSY